MRVASLLEPMRRGRSVLAPRLVETQPCEPPFESNGCRMVGYRHLDERPFARTAQRSPFFKACSTSCQSVMSRPRASTSTPTSPAEAIATSTAAPLWARLTARFDPSSSGLPVGPRATRTDSGDTPRYGAAAASIGRGVSGGSRQTATSSASSAGCIGGESHPPSSVKRQPRNRAQRREPRGSRPRRLRRSAGAGAGRARFPAASSAAGRLLWGFSSVRSAGQRSLRVDVRGLVGLPTRSNSGGLWVAGIVDRAGSAPRSPLATASCAAISTATAPPRQKPPSMYGPRGCTLRTAST